MRKLGVNRSRRGARIRAEKLIDDKIVVATGLSSKWARRKAVRLAELQREPRILTPPIRSIPRALLRRSRPRGSRNLSPTSRNIFGASAHAFAGVWKIHHGDPFSTFRANARRFGLVELPIKLPMRPWPVAVVLLKNRTLSPIVERFIACAREMSKTITSARQRCG